MVDGQRDLFIAKIRRAPESKREAFFLFVHCPEKALLYGSCRLVSLFQALGSVVAQGVAEVRGRRYERPSFRRVRVLDGVKDLAILDFAMAR
jgi:hypothetical protein